MLYDLQRGKLPYYVLPPGLESEAVDVAVDDSDAQLNGALAFPEGTSLPLTDGTTEPSEHEEPYGSGKGGMALEEGGNETVQSVAAALEEPPVKCISRPNKRAKAFSPNNP